MKISQKKDVILLKTAHTISFILILAGFLSLVAAFYIPDEFQAKNPNFILVLWYCIFIFILLGVFLEIYQKKSLIRFYLTEKKIVINELYSGKKAIIEIEADSIKEFHLYQRYESGSAPKSYVYELHLIDKQNNNFILADLKNLKAIQNLVEQISIQFEKKFIIFSKSKDITTDSNRIIAYKPEFQSEFWHNRSSVFNSNWHIPEDKKSLQCIQDKDIEQISWSLKQQNPLALLSGFLGLGMVLFFATIIIPFKGYTISISIGLLISILFTLISIMLFIYTNFAKSVISISQNLISFDIQLFKTSIFSQKIPHEKIMHIAGSFDSWERNEIVLLTQKGFELLYRNFDAKESALDEKLLKSNILIINTKPLLSTTRYFLYGRLHQKVK